MAPKRTIADYGHNNLVIMVMVVVFVAGVLAACQSNQSTAAQTPTLAEPTDFPAGFPTPDPEDFAACMAEGGRWELLGFSGPGCNLPS